MSELLGKLSAPFSPDRVSWRVGSTTQDKKKGMALAYIDARDVQDRLNDVAGLNWQDRYPHAGQKTVCEIGLRFGEEWLWRSDGAGDSDVEAEKGALSDAFKRAAVKWGIGRYLYDIESPWVEIVQKGKSYVIAPHELKRLQGLLPGSKVATTPEQSEQPEMTERKLTKPQARPEYDKLVKEFKAIQDVNDLKIWGARNKPRLDAMPEDWQVSLRDEYAEHKSTLNGVHQ